MEEKTKELLEKQLELLSKQSEKGANLPELSCAMVTVAGALEGRETISI